MNAWKRATAIYRIPNQTSLLPIKAKQIHYDSQPVETSRVSSLLDKNFANSGSTLSTTYSVFHIAVNHHNLHHDSCCMSLTRSVLQSTRFFFFFLSSLALFPCSKPPQCGTKVGRVGTPGVPLNSKCQRKRGEVTNETVKLRVPEQLRLFRVVSSRMCLANYQLVPWQLGYGKWQFPFEIIGCRRFLELHCYN